MSSYSSVNIGNRTYGGSQRYISDPQQNLFNRSDLHAQGTKGKPGFLRAYRITVGELRRRLESLGYTPANTRDAIRCTAKDAKGKPPRSGDERTVQFLEHLSSVTTENLLELAQAWKEPSKEIDYEELLTPNFHDFSRALLEFVQGAVVDLLELEKVWLSGYHFERLLCEVFEDHEIFELDFTALVEAGWYEPDDVPVGDAYDRDLALLTPGGFVMGQQVTQEESAMLEFKSVSGANPCKSIASQIPRYVIGFLNRDGGKILFGVNDDGCVSGVDISREDRDELVRLVNSAGAAIVPAAPLSALNTTFLPIISGGRQLNDRFVVEVAVGPGRPQEMYFRQSGETWIRVGTETRSLSGHALFVHVCSRYGQADGLLSALSERVRVGNEEIERLRVDGKQHLSELAHKEERVQQLQQALSTLQELVDEAEVLCPECNAALIQRNSYPIYGYIDGREVEADAEYLAYDCGYATADGRPVSPCKRSG